VRGGAKLPEQAAFAAALRSRPNATITGPLVLHLLGVPSFHGATAYEILRQPTRRLRGVSFLHRIDPDPERAVTTRGMVRTAGPLDALIDSAGAPGSGSERDLRVAYDHLRAKFLITEQRLRERCARLDGLAPGARALLELLELAGGTTVESEGERHLAPFASCFEPALEPQVWVIPSARRLLLTARPLRFRVRRRGGPRLRRGAHRRRRPRRRGA
jgi:hypothetical protein